MYKHKIFYFITLGLLLLLCFPPIKFFVSFRPSLVLGVFVVAALILFPSLITRRSIIWVFVFTIMTIVYHLFGNAYYSTFNAVIIPFLCMMTGLVITEYAMTYDKDSKYTRMVLITVISLNVIMAIITIPQIWINPNIIRSKEVFESAMYKESTESFTVISYNTVHGLPFIFPPLVFLCMKMLRIDKKVFYYIVISTVILFYLVLIANAVMAFFISTMVVFMTLLFREESFNSRNVTRMLLFGLLMFLLTNQNVAVPIINFVQGFTDEGGFTYYRLDEIKGFIMYGEVEGDLYARQIRYDISQKLFWESPFVGTSNPELVSLHTWIWDMLAIFGIIFIIPLVMIFVTHIKDVYRRLVRSRVVYVFGVVAYLLMLYFKNSFGVGTWLYAFGILPVACHYIDSVLEKYRL